MAPVQYVGVSVKSAARRATWLSARVVRSHYVGQKGLKPKHPRRFPPLVRNLLGRDPSWVVVTSLRSAAYDQQRQRSLPHRLRIESTPSADGERNRLRWRHKMGFLDKLKGQASGLKDKAVEAVGQNSDKIHGGLDKAGEMLDKQTKGKYSDKIQTGTAKAKEGITKLDKKNTDGQQPNPLANDPLATVPLGSDPASSAPTGSPVASDPVASDPLGSDRMGEEPSTSDRQGADHLGTDPIGTPVTSDTFGSETVPDEASVNDPYGDGPQHRA